MSTKCHKIKSPIKNPVFITQRSERGFFLKQEKMRRRKPRFHYTGDKSVRNLALSGRDFNLFPIVTSAAESVNAIPLQLGLFLISRRLPVLYYLAEDFSNERYYAANTLSDAMLNWLRLRKCNLWHQRARNILSLMDNRVRKIHSELISFPPRPTPLQEVGEEPHYMTMRLPGKIDSDEFRGRQVNQQARISLSTTSTRNYIIS